MRAIVSPPLGELPDVAGGQSGREVRRMETLRAVLLLRTSQGHLWAFVG